MLNELKQELDEDFDEHDHESQSASTLHIARRANKRKCAGSFSYQTNCDTDCLKKKDSEGMIVPVKDNRCSLGAYLRCLICTKDVSCANQGEPNSTQPNSVGL